MWVLDSSLRFAAFRMTEGEVGMAEGTVGMTEGEVGMAEGTVG